MKYLLEINEPLTDGTHLGAFLVQNGRIICVDIGERDILNTKKVIYPKIKLIPKFYRRLIEAPISFDCSFMKYIPKNDYKRIGEEIFKQIHKLPTIIDAPDFDPEEE